MTPRRLRALPVLWLILAACDDTPAPAGPVPCATDAWQQPTRRFAVGSTLLLPVIDPASSPGCVGTAWRLDAAPAGNANLVVGGERFTPHLAGAHRFVRDGVDQAFEVTAIDAGAAPFHQLNYYPTRSLALVDGPGGAEIWATGVYAPLLARLDRATGDPVGAAIPVGAWPVALAVSARAGAATEVLVAERGSDELGVVDVAGARRVDGIHVGDEPASVVVSPDGATAYVALAVSGEIAVVDVAARAVVARVALAPDLLGLAISPDGTRLFAARHRSGHPDRYPYAADPVAEERDVFVVDTTTRAVVGELVDVGTTLKALHVSDDGARLYVAGLENHTAGPLGRPDESLSFVQSVKVFATADLELLAAADLSRQASSTGDVVSLHGMAELDGKLWVAAEGIDRLVALDPVTLAEVDRAQAPGRPRFLVADAGELLVHGAQGFVVSTVAADGALVRQSPTGVDPRPPAIARGQRYFTGQGRGFATTWSCNSCHADGLSDTLIWNAGPLVDRVTARPFTWLEGAYPLGWAGYMYDVWNYAYEVNGNVGIRPVTGEARDLGAYLASLMPPPAATDATGRDGRLGAAAERGRALYEGAAGCAACHGLPLTTSRGRMPEGVTEGVTDIPVLAGAYRHGTWLKHGDARALPAAVVRVVEWLGVPTLGAGELDDLVSYLGTLAGGDFFVLATTPREDDTPMAADEPLRVTFSQPVWGDAANLAHVRLVDAAGADVPVDVTLEDPADAHRVIVTPRARLAFDAAHELVVDAELEAWNERRVRPTRVALHTARAPALRLEGDYVFHVDMPVLDFALGGFDPTRTNPVRVAVSATPTAAGARLRFDLGQGLVFERTAVIDGDTLWLPPAPIPVGPSFGDAIPDGAGTLVDAGADGVADGAAQTFTMAGPGFLVGAIAWRLERPIAGCPEGHLGDVTVEVQAAGPGGPVAISWSGDSDAVALYVTDAAASIPLGPGPVTGGASYWIVQSAMFPTGFAGPVTYGVVPAGAVEAGAASMAAFEELQSGKCYKVSVTTTALTVSSKTFVWP